MIKNNVFDTALIFEGGGMRASYTAGMLCALLENNIYFDYAAGISAGATHCINYISRDTERAKRSFVDLVNEPNFGGWTSFLKGKGYFNAEFIYEQTPYAKCCLPLDFKTFIENPAQIKIGAFDMNRGKMKYFGKEDIYDIASLVKIVRASSSLPIFMPHTHIEDDEYIDGGLGGGIALDIAKKDGYQKFFVILTRPKGYVKKPVKSKSLIKTVYRHYPDVVDAIFNRHKLYNETLEELRELEKQGKAYLVYPDVMPVSNRETNFYKLYKSFTLGCEQAIRDIDKWAEFLGISKKIECE